MREQENIEEQRKQKRYRGELEIEEMKLNMKREYEKKKEEWERTELTASEISKGSNKQVWEYPSLLVEILELV